MRKKKLLSLFLTASLAVSGIFSGNAPQVSLAEEKVAEDMVTAYVAIQGHSAAGSQAAISKKAVYLEYGSSAADAVSQVLKDSEYKYDIQDTAYGPYLESINGMGTEQEGNNWYYWGFYVNGQYQEAGMGGYTLQDNDKISLIYTYEDDSTEAKDFQDDESLNPTKEQEEALFEAAKKQQEVLSEKVYQQYFGEGYIPGIENNADGLYIAFSLLRAGYEAPDGFYEKTCEKVEKQLSELGAFGKLSYQTVGEDGSVATELLTEEEILSSGTAAMNYAKTVLFLTAMGKDATQTGGYDLIEKMASLEVYESSSENYMLAPTVLLALDSGKYILPAGDGYITRTRLVNEITDAYYTNLSLAIRYSSVDMIAMPLQAIAPYKKVGNPAAAERAPNYDQNQVDAICEKGILFMENMQSSVGLYGDEWTANNVWTLAQVMTAMGQFGINAASEEDGTDFIKNGKTVLDAAAEFVNVEEGTLDSTLEGPWGMPEQLLRGLNACIRVSEGEDILYEVTEPENMTTSTAWPVTEPTAWPEKTSAPDPTATDSPREDMPVQTVTPDAIETDAPTGTGAPEQSATQSPEGTGAPEQSTTQSPTGTGAPEQSTTQSPTGTGAPVQSTTQAPAQTATVVSIQSATPASVTASPTLAPSTSPVKKVIKVTKITVKKGSKTIRGTLNVKKAKVTITVKRGTKSVGVKSLVLGKHFTGRITKKVAKKLITGKKTKAAIKKNVKLMEKDKVTIQVKKSGYQTLKKTYSIK